MNTVAKLTQKQIEKLSSICRGVDVTWLDY